ncbi:hypothetical protein SLA2020_221590 [Shorea laevis]
MCFNDGFSHKLGDGSKTRLWKDDWLGSSPLKLDFQCMFNLSLCKDSYVTDLKPQMMQALQRRRPLFGREMDKLVMLEDILKDVHVSDGKADQFILNLCPMGYSTKKGLFFSWELPSLS